MWVEFEQGDPDFPIWTGGWWGASSELPSLASATAPGIGQVTIVTPGRQALVISDLPGPLGGISVRMSTGAHISVADGGIVIDNGQGAAIALTGNQVQITGVMV